MAKQADELDQRWIQWQSDWELAHAAIENLPGSSVEPIIISKPISEYDFRSLCAEYFDVMPRQLIQLTTHCASFVRFTWKLPPEGVDVPEEFQEVYHGGGGEYKGDLWNAVEIPQLKRLIEQICRDTMRDPEDLFEGVWHKKVPFIDVGTGDLIALDISNGVDDCPVIYISDDFEESFGWRLGEDLFDFLSRWSALGCPGPDSQLSKCLPLAGAT